MTRGWVLAVGAVAVGAFLAGLWTRNAREVGPAPVDDGAPSGRAEDEPVEPRRGHRAAGVGASATAAASAAPPGGDALTRTRGHGVPVPELFEAEGRDTAWATAVESAATASYLRVLSVVAPWASTVVVDCRTTLCKVSLDVEEAQVRASMDRLQAVSVGAGVSPFAEQGDNGHWRAGVYVLFDRDERSSAIQPRYWTDGVDARFPGGNAQLQTWLAESERRAREEEQQRAVGAGP